jgi:hypothetical protein
MIVKRDSGSTGVWQEMGPAQNSERGETGYERTKQTQETNGKNG